MSSRRRIQASRTNGRLSQGPITPEGKAISAQNARTHQLTSASVILRNEDRAVLDKMLTAYSAHFAPDNPLDWDLVEEIAVAKWRQRRLWAVETAAIDHEMDRQEKDPDQQFEKMDQTTRLALAYKNMTDDSRLLSNLSRYESRLRRAYQTAAEKLAKQIGKNEPSPFPDTR